jgi:hypothetical protein
MKYIQIQDDAKSDNKWVAEYLGIGEAWESVSISLNGKIDGLITPFGIDIKLDIRINNREKIMLTARKHLENITSSVFNTKISPFSRIVEIKTDLRQNSRRGRLKVVRNSFINRLKGLVSKFQNKEYLVNYICFYDDTELLKILKSTDILNIQKLGSLNIDSEIARLVAYSLIEKEEYLLKTINDCKILNDKIR